MPRDDGLAKASPASSAAAMVQHGSADAAAEPASPLQTGAGGAMQQACRCETFGRSLRCAWRGVRATFGSQRNMRIQCVIAAAVAMAGTLLRLQPLEWAAIILCAAAVFVAEITNTALEAVVDLVSPGYSDAARLAKDAAAGAVLVASAASVLVGLAVLGPRLIALLRS